MFGRLEKTKSFPRDRVIIIPTSCEKAISTCDLDETPTVELRRLNSSEKLGPEKARNVLLASKLTADKRNATFYSGDSLRIKRSKFYEKLNEVVSSPKKPYSTMQPVFGKEAGKVNLLESKSIIRTDAAIEGGSKQSAKFEVNQLENPEKRQKSNKREENIFDLGYKPVGNMEKLDLTMTARFERPVIKEEVLDPSFKKRNDDRGPGSVFKPDLEGNKTPLFGAGLPKESETNKASSLFSAGGFGQTASAFITDSKPQSDSSKPSTSLLSSSSQPSSLFGNTSQLGNSDANAMKASIFPVASTTSNPSSLFSNPSGSLFGSDSQKPSLGNETVQESKKLFEANTNPESSKGPAGSSSSAGFSTTPLFGGSGFASFTSGAGSTTAPAGPGMSLFAPNALSNPINATNTTNTTNTINTINANNANNASTSTTAANEKTAGLFVSSESIKTSLFSSTEASKPLAFGQTDANKSSSAASFLNPSPGLFGSGDNKGSLFGQTGDSKLPSGTPADSAKTGSLFGGSANLAAGVFNSASTPKTGLFSSKPETQSGSSLFSSGSNQGGLLAGFKPSTGPEASESKPASSGGLFGSAATTGTAFAASSSNSGETKTSLFSTVNAASGTQASGLFGASTSLSTPQVSGTSASLFGTKSEPGLFGSNPFTSSDKASASTENKSVPEAAKSTPFGLGFSANSFQGFGIQSTFPKTNS